MKPFLSLRSLKKTASRIIATTDLNWTFQIDFLEGWLSRISLYPETGLVPDKSWMIAPKGDTPWEGRPKLSNDGFTCPDYQAHDQEEKLELTCDHLQITLAKDKLRLSISQKLNGQYISAFEDRETGAYYLTDKGEAVRHYQINPETFRHFGLGDKSGPLDRSARRYRILQMDALGYNAETSDPLYKHIPFVILQDKITGGAIGLLYDCLSEMVFDLGCEHSNYHQRYRYIEAKERGLTYYVIAGPKISDVVRRLSQLTGRPHFQPRWSMGFAFTSMHHADDDNAQEVILNFAKQCRDEKIPISAIHFGSGYTTRENLRYVFTWNREKFPDTSTLFGKLKEMGLHTMANTKPVLLTDHPAYQETNEAGAFIKGSDEKPAIGRFWDADGSYLDFTSEVGINWWKTNARKAVLDAGFDSIWNDNNETEIWDDEATVDGFGVQTEAKHTRPLHSLLMTRASFETTLDKDPKSRPYTVTRAGCVGLQRYAETWTGDNYTSWHTLKWNLLNGLSLGLSGIPYIGHDIGGFAGPRPDPELFVRWVQMMAVHPRCLMNSWKPEVEAPNLPWMHPEVLEHVRSALDLRYQLLPYLYAMAHNAHINGDPIIRPMFYDHEDPECYEQPECFMLGKNILVAPAVNQGQTEVTVYCPKSEHGWFDFYSNEWSAGGQIVTLKAELDRLPLLVKAGAVLPLAKSWKAGTPHNAEVIELRAYLPKTSHYSTHNLFYDNGQTWDYQQSDKTGMTCDLQCDETEVKLSVETKFNMENAPKLEAGFVGLKDRKAMFNKG